MTEAKLKMYKTAFSPEFNTYVGIVNVFFNEEWDEWCIQARLCGQEIGAPLYTFTPFDLTDYCL